MTEMAERITKLETELAALKVQYTNIDTKLDTLLSLKDKGVGAFWLASGLVGTGIIGIVSGILDVIKHAGG